MKPLASVCDANGTVPAPHEPLEHTALLGVVLGPLYSQRAKGDAPSLTHPAGRPFSKVSEYIGLPNTCAIKDDVVKKDNRSNKSRLDIIRFKVYQI